MVKFIFIIAFLVISPQLPVPLQKRRLSRFAPSAQKRHTVGYPRGEVILGLCTKASNHFAYVLGRRKTRYRLVSRFSWLDECNRS